MKNPEYVKEWMRRARSNLARTEAGSVNEYIVFEDLCFDAQQAAEKSLKALCIAEGIIFSRTHNIGHLLELLDEADMFIPEDILVARSLTEYAVEMRYPGDYEEATEEEYRKALATAKKVVSWVESKLKDC